MPPIIYLEKHPAPALRPWIRALWYCFAPEVPHRHERVLPNGCGQVILNLARDFLTECADDLTESKIPRAIVVGPRLRYELIATHDLTELAGVVLQPGGFPGLFRERANLLANRFTDLRDLSPKIEVSRVIEAPTPAAKLDALEGMLGRMARSASRRNPFVDGTLRLLQQPNASVRECARTQQISERRLLQLFREQVGFSPKIWYRLQRFQQALQQVHRGREVCWPDLILRCGYYDQAHFINDFRAFSGINPTTYLARRTRWQNHLSADFSNPPPPPQGNVDL